MRSKSTPRLAPTSSSAAAAMAAPTATPKLTIPHSPKFRTDSRLKGASAKPSEMAEVERIQHELELERQVREENRKNLARVLQSVGEVLPARSAQPLTVRFLLRFYCCNVLLLLFFIHMSCHQPFLHYLLFLFNSSPSFLALPFFSL